jgi:hypothetical protein
MGLQINSSDAIPLSMACPGCAKPFKILVPISVYTEGTQDTTSVVIQTPDMSLLMTHLAQTHPELVANQLGGRPELRTSA